MVASSRAVSIRSCAAGLDSRNAAPHVLTDEVIGVHRLLPSERGGRGQGLGPDPVLLPLPDLQHDQPIRLGQCGQVQGGQRRHHVRPGRGREQGSHIQLRSTGG